MGAIQPLWQVRPTSPACFPACSWASGAARPPLQLVIDTWHLYLVLMDSFEMDSDFHRGNETYIQYLQAKKTMEVKKESEKFRVGGKVKLLERRVFKLQAYIAGISLVSIFLAVLIQEISFYGTYSDALGGDWFTQTSQPPIPISELQPGQDLKYVITMKFVLSKLTLVQLVLMIAQFRIVTNIMIEQKQLDSTSIDSMAEAQPVVTLTGSFGYSSSYLLLLKYTVELAACAVFPMPFIKKKFITTIVGRSAIYNLESLVCSSF